MIQNNPITKDKAKDLIDVSASTEFSNPIPPDHPFYTDFSKVRGDYQENEIYEALNIDFQNMTYDAIKHSFHKPILFLSGMRGTGKSTEILKYVKKMENPNCFFCVVCNIDEELDMNNVEYMDILILQISKLLEKLKEKDINLGNHILENVYTWSQQRIEEVNKRTDSKIDIESGGGAQTPSLLLNTFNLFSNIKASFSGGIERTDIVRTVFKNNFTEFTSTINTFFREVAQELRNNNIAQDILFVVDGIEKTMTADLRKKIIIDDSNRLKSINVNTIFTLPIELYRYKTTLKQFSEVISFPFIKLQEQDGSYIPEAKDKLKEFISKRVDHTLFQSEEIIDKVVVLSGGSPRELLRIVKNASRNARLNYKKNIDKESLQATVKKLANETADGVTPEEFTILKELNKNNQEGKKTATTEEMLKLLEDLIIFEYNDCTYKRVNPIVAESDLYKQYVE